MIDVVEQQHTQGLGSAADTPCGAYRSRNAAREARDAREQHELENPPPPAVMRAREARAARESLRMRAYCRWHHSHYPANKRAPGFGVVAADCPHCEQERVWIRKAVEVHGRELFDRDPNGLTWLAQKMAGYRFMRYRAEPPAEGPRGGA